MVKLTLHVCNITGNTFTIHCDNKNTIYDLKQTISDHIEDYSLSAAYEPYLFRLICNGIELDNNELFINLSPIQNDMKLWYLMKLNPEIEILLEIKRKMGINLNWSRDLELSEWNRINIDNESNSKFKVIILDLYGLQLTGEIPKEIGKLINLRRLYLYNNELFINQSPIQNDMKLRYLMKLNPEIEILLEIKRKMGLNLNWSRDLELSEWNRIYINNESTSKFKVTTLYLNTLQLTGEIPKEIGKLMNLQYLYLYNNQLTGEIPKEIGKLTNLQYLFLNMNKLTGKIPKEIGKLTNLTSKDFSGNKLVQ